MKKALTLTLAVALFGILAAVVVAGVGQDPPAGSTTPATATTEDRTTTTEAEDRRDVRDDDAPGDISGPCDEAEHANDPRCDGVADPRPANPAQPAGGVDISGPCDEAEHANDPRCTTGAGRIEDDHGDDAVDNSGPGNAEDRGIALDDDDHSGSGHGGGDDDSGHGGGDDD
jgi:hypothetical protein